MTDRPEAQPEHPADETLETAAEAEASEAPAEQTQDGGDDLAEKLAEREQEILRLHAEMENLRKRAERDVENARKFALERFVEGLLPVVDSLEMGIEAAGQENATLEKIREGTEMTMEMFQQVLEKFGVQPVHPLGERFNPEHHQAMSMQPHDSEPDHVVDVMQKGYLLKERLVRPALVVVSKPKG